ncbi:hypothetical protein N8275_11300, partial [Pseudomonadales bacterium]|nr:hypothetical protein [Pseudomonadales bacterium]
QACSAYSLIKPAGRHIFYHQRHSEFVLHPAFDSVACRLQPCGGKLLLILFCLKAGNLVRSIEDAEAKFVHETR